MTCCFIDDIAEAVCCCCCFCCCAGTLGLTFCIFGSVTLCVDVGGVVDDAMDIVSVFC